MSAPRAHKQDPTGHGSPCCPTAAMVPHSRRRRIQQSPRPFRSRRVNGRSCVVVSVILLGILASKHAPTNHGGRLSSLRLGSLYPKSIASLVGYGGMMHGGGGGKLGGIGPGDKVSYRMQFCASIDDGGHHCHMIAVGPHSQLLSIQQSAKKTMRQVGIVNNRKNYHY